MNANDKPPVVFLSGERVYLRPFESEDVASSQRWLNDPAVRVPLGAFLPITEKAEREFIESAVVKDENIHLAIVLREGNRLLGSLGVKNIRWKDRAATFGIFIGPAECRGRGYGTEATRLFLDYAFQTLNLNRVELEVFSTNEAGLRAYEKAGFVREGVQREQRFIDGRYVDQVLFSILAREYIGSCSE
ncbi:MAG: GNAT family N-acetyltransferase [Phycisphaerae bacterium]|nr:GNAT family N-acetyltransferase [Phycisphaerae bacterium]